MNLVQTGFMEDMLILRAPLNTKADSKLDAFELTLSFDNVVDSMQITCNDVFKAFIVAVIVLSIVSKRSFDVLESSFAVLHYYFYRS